MNKEKPNKSTPSFKNDQSKTQTNKNSVGNYRIEKTIGEGTFGKVKLGIHLPTLEKVAIKILEKDKIIEKEDLDRVTREIKFLKKLKHPNIIKIFEIIEDFKCFYIIMEYAAGGELFNYIVNKRRLEDREASFFFSQIIQGIEYIHKNNIVHRDLKPENLLLNEQKQLKIIDFGLSNQYKSNQLLGTPCGSPCYAAPEMILGKRYSGLMIDIWSTGIILFAMICGYLPFEHKNNDKLYQKILECKLEIPDFVTPMCKDMILRILTLDPSKRIKLDEIKSHQFYKYGERLVAKETQTINVNKLHDTVIEKMKQLGYDKTEVNYNLESKKHNNITTTYELLFNKTKHFLLTNNNNNNNISSSSTSGVNSNITTEKTSPAMMNNNINININYMNKINNININITDVDLDSEKEQYLKTENSTTSRNDSPSKVPSSKKRSINISPKKPSMSINLDIANKIKMGVLTPKMKKNDLFVKKVGKLQKNNDIFQRVNTSTTSDYGGDKQLTNRSTKSFTKAFLSTNKTSNKLSEKEKGRSYSKDERLTSNFNKTVQQSETNLNNSVHDKVSVNTNTQIRKETRENTVSYKKSITTNTSKMNSSKYVSNFKTHTKNFSIAIENSEKKLDLANTSDFLNSSQSSLKTPKRKILSFMKKNTSKLDSSSSNFTDINLNVQNKVIDLTATKVINNTFVRKPTTPIRSKTPSINLDSFTKSLKQAKTLKTNASNTSTTSNAYSSVNTNLTNNTDIIKTPITIQSKKTLSKNSKEIYFSATTSSTPAKKGKVNDFACCSIKNNVNVYEKLKKLTTTNKYTFKEFGHNKYECGKNGNVVGIEIVKLAEKETRMMKLFHLKGNDKITKELIKDILMNIGL